MKLTISKTRTFIPEFNGNKDCSPTEQIEVTIKNPTIAIKDKVFSRPETVARADANGRVEGIDISLKTDDVAVLRAMVEKSQIFLTKMMTERKSRLYLSQIFLPLLFSLLR